MYGHMGTWHGRWMDDGWTDMDRSILYIGVGVGIGQERFIPRLQSSYIRTNENVGTGHTYNL